MPTMISLNKAELKCYNNVLTFSFNLSKHSKYNTQELEGGRHVQRSFSQASLEHTSYTSNAPWMEMGSPLY